MALSADEIIVLSVPEEDVISGHAMDDVIACFAVQFIAENVVAGVAECIIQVLSRAWHNPHRAVSVVVECDVVVAGDAVDSHDAEDVAIVAEYHVGVAGVSVERFITRIVSCGSCAGTPEDHIITIRSIRDCGSAEQTGAASDNVVLSKVAQDDVVAAATFDVVVPVSADAVDVIS